MDGVFYQGPQEVACEVIIMLEMMYKYAGQDRDFRC
jgi:hypothetical protein